MPKIVTAQYENYLKTAYVVRKQGKILAVTDTSCYTLGEETAWLTSALPYSGRKEDYLIALLELGILEPEKVFDKLVSLGVLAIKCSRSWRDILRVAISPKIRLFPAQFQERVLRIIGIRIETLNNFGKVAGGISFLGLLWGIALLIYGPAKVLALPLVGKASGVAVFLLVISGSLLHELGHSCAAAACGIGFRPIGFSVYLIYPVFYTNVSGIDSLGLKAKVLIDCGGFYLQLIFLFSLLFFSSFSGNPSAVEASRWIMAIILFNLNPFFRTDGYWLYKDIYSRFKTERWAYVAQGIYLIAFFVFSIYFLWCMFGRLEHFKQGVTVLFHNPRYGLSGGYRILLGAYFVFVGMSGGLQRFRDGHQEWKELLASRKRW